MNKKRFFLLLATVLLVLAALPAFCGLRFDTGLYLLTGLGGDTDDQIDLLFMFIGAHYQWALGPAKIGPGLRACTMIVLTLWWPDVVAEVELGPVAIEGHFGGPCFGEFLGESLSGGGVFVPELSAWVKLGKNFRLGAGGIGFTNLDTAVFVFFFGVKWVQGD